MSIVRVQQVYPVPSARFSELVDSILKDSILQNECVY